MARSIAWCGCQSLALHCHCAGACQTSKSLGGFIWFEKPVQSSTHFAQSHIVSVTIAKNDFKDFPTNPHTEIVYYKIVSEPAFFHLHPWTKVPWITLLCTFVHSRQSTEMNATMNVAYTRTLVLQRTISYCSCALAVVVEIQILNFLNRHRGQRGHFCHFWLDVRADPPS